LAYCQDILARGEDLLLIDADAEFSPAAPAFGSVLSEHPNADILFVNGISGRPNSGVMIMRGGAGSAATALMETCLANRETPVPKEDFVTAEGENGHILHFLKQPRFAERAAALPLAWNCTVASGFSTAFVRHYTNELRRRLTAGDLWDALSTPLSLRSEAEGQARGLAFAHAWGRSAHLAALTQNPARMEEFRQLVQAIGGLNHLTFPRLLHDRPDAWMWRYEFATGLLEASTVAAVARTVRPGAVVLDGGAHVGYFSRAIHNQLGGDCRIVAVEAHPANLEQLAANIGSSTEIVHCALGEDKGMAVLFDGSGHSNSTLVPGRHPGATGIEVPMNTIDRLCADRGVGRLDFMKLDVEGFELQALLGAAAIIDASPDLVIQIELNPRLLALNSVSPADILTFAYRKGLVTRMHGEDFAFRPAGFVDEKETRNYFMARPERWATLETALFGEAGTGPRWKGPKPLAEASAPPAQQPLRKTYRRLRAAVGRRLPWRARK
jgi:FkbM family methyltransferase